MDQILLCRQTISRPRDQWFVTFPSEQLVIPDTGNYTVYYAPNDTDLGKKMLS